MSKEAEAANENETENSFQKLVDEWERPPCPNF